MTREITKFDDIIDSRDVIRRIDELESERATLENAVEEAQTLLDDDVEPGDNGALQHAQDILDDATGELEDWGKSEEAEELKALKAFAEEAAGYASDWFHGAELIHDSYFETYAFTRIAAEDCGDYNARDVKLPYTCIDWEKAATELQGDYSAVDFDGETYWTR